MSSSPFQTPADLHKWKSLADSKAICNSNTVIGQSFIRSLLCPSTCCSWAIADLRIAKQSFSAWSDLPGPVDECHLQGGESQDFGRRKKEAKRQQGSSWKRSYKKGLACLMVPDTVILSGTSAALESGLNCKSLRNMSLLSDYPNAVELKGKL